MKLRPSLREKKRYIVIEVVKEVKIDSGNSLINYSNLGKVIEKALLDYLGILGMSEVGYLFIESKGNKCIIRVSAKSLEKSRAALAFVKEIDGNKVMLNPIFVSGSIKVARDKL